MVPLLSEYWRPINGLEHGGAAEWRADNRRLAPIAAAVDVNMPSLYAYYDDRDGWVRQAKALVCEARRYSDKPVIAFIWPEFHPSSKPSGTAIPGDYWRLQLETLADIADGVVIWGGYDLARERAEPWDANAPWWHETLDFLARHRRNPLLRPVG
jgi:AcrR family transcriptional regulator